MSQYLAAARSKHVLKSKSDAKVGIVVAAGEILDGHQPPGKIGGESTADLLRQARYDKAVKAVVLRVDSPGGSMFASELILREVQALRKAGKPVVVSMSTYAASGGYYISAAANQIFASPTTLTGSIGVFSVVPTFQRTLEKLGVKVDGLGTTPLAGDMRLDRRARRRGRQQILQSSVDHAYDEFLHRVGEGRKKSVEDVDKIAQGRVWAGVDAQRIGLVDHLGGLKDATDAAAKLAELGSDYDVRLHRAGAIAARGAADAAALRRRCAWAQMADSSRRAATSSARSIRCSSRPARSPSSTIRAGCTRIAGASSPPCRNGC